MKTNTFTVVVNYARPLSGMITWGRYKWSDDRIEYLYRPVWVKDGDIRVEKEMILVHPNRVVGCDEVIRMIMDQGLELGTIEDLLAFGEQRPEVWCEFLISLGSIVDDFGERKAPSISNWIEGRLLRLISCDYGFSEEFFFLATRKV